jgi:hypothetical protein
MKTLKSIFIIIVVLSLVVSILGIMKKKDLPVVDDIKIPETPNTDSNGLE